MNPLSESQTDNSKFLSSDYFNLQQTASEQSDAEFGQDEGDRVAQTIQNETEDIVQEMRSTIESDVSLGNVDPTTAKRLLISHKIIL